MILDKMKVSNDEYEAYTIHLPFNVIVHGKPRKFIYSELEKRHPCFSDDCCFATRYFLRKKGIESQVVVFNKLKFSEIKKKNIFRNVLLSLDGLKHSLYFSTAFSEKNHKVEIIFFLLILFFVIALSFVKSSKSIGNVRNQTTVVNSLEKRDVGVQEEKELFTVEVSLQKVNSFLNELEKTGGKIRNLEWTSDGYGEKFTAKVKGVYPEDVIHVRESEQLKDYVEIASYVNSIPEFDIHIEDRITNKNGNKERRFDEIQDEVKISFFKELRTLINKFNYSLHNENYRKNCISFSFNDYRPGSETNFFCELFELCKKYDFAIDKLIIHNTGFSEGKQYSSIKGEISFNPFLSWERGLNLESLAWRENLIYEKDLFTKNKSTLITNVSVQKNTDKRIQNEFLVGQIRHADGSTTSYYKNREGKIIWEK